MTGIITRCLILSDTHADANWKPDLSSVSADVALHCGDLIEESKLFEFASAIISLLKSINAPLKLVIAGNHDFTLDTPLFKRKIAEAAPPLEQKLVRKEFGNYGDAQQLFDDAKEAGIILLSEGRHTFTLANRARLTVYASPYTPFRHGEHHNFSIDADVDVVMTHGPPRGVLDITDSKQRAGCEQLFAAIARARPQLHCFGHIHEGWGAKLVAWRGLEATESPSHFTDIDNEHSVTLETLSSLREGKYDTPEAVAEKQRRLETYRGQGYCRASSGRRSHCVGGNGVQQTLFVNAAIQGLERGFQLPWLVDIELPRAVGDGKEGRKCGKEEVQHDGELPVGMNTASPSDGRDEAEKAHESKEDVSASH